MRSSYLERGRLAFDAQPQHAPLTGDGRDQSRCAAQGASVPAVAHPLERGQGSSEAHTSRAPLNTFDGDHPTPGTRAVRVAVEEEQAPAVVGQRPGDAQTPTADHAGALLLVLADALDDIERTRIANENRLRSLTTVKGLADTDVAAVTLAAIVHDLKAVEARSVKALENAMRSHPLGPWVRRTTGLGLKQTARLLAAVGDPAWNDKDDRPRRGPAELWQFAGHGDPARSKLRKGQPVEHSPTAKMRTRMVSEAAVKAGVRKVDGCDDSDGYDLAHRIARTPYGQAYLNARASWADRDVSDGHAHNHALRLVGKAILRDLFIEARAQDQSSREAQSRAVEGA